jgi:peptidyl-prolyl cis-trans isomerase SurA
MGTRYRVADLDKAYNENLGDGQQQEKPSADQADAARLGLLHQLIDEEILLQRAANMSLNATPEEVDAKLAEMKAQYSEEQFTQLLTEHHTSVDEVKRDLRRSLTENKLLNKEINSKITVSDADINSYFQAHKYEFHNIETQYHIAQILLSNTPSRPPEEARKKISALKNRVDSGEDFGALAMNFSEDPQTSSSGGDMGLLSESQLTRMPLLFAAIAKLKPGQTTDIIPFPNPANPKKEVDYAIFQLISRDLAGQHDVSEPQVQQRIREQLKNARSQLLKVAYFEMLRNRANVENFFAEQISKTDAR